ncbi:MAG: AMP-binding protein, partial [Caulobacterales bacterium]|nr:AMP-binding protein [Caulobacterales bacterium]
MTVMNGVSQAPSMPAGARAGLMQSAPVNLAHILEHGARAHADVEVVTAQVEGGRHRQTYAETAARARRCANALKRLGMRPGDRIGTLAWNTHRHLEAWFAIPGQGAICHTVNPRLFPEQLTYIINH